jgi:hypothetical protein
MQDILPEQFLSVVNRYKFIEDVRESNLMIVYDKDKEEYIYIDSYKTNTKSYYKSQNFDFLSKDILC